MSEGEIQSTSPSNENQATTLSNTSHKDSSNSSIDIKPKIPPKIKVENTVEGVSLIEDNFGQFFDNEGISHQIKRFTWKNKNHIQIQAINYGAKVISIKLPDRKGQVEDVLLGFDDLAGYIFYENFFFGSLIGRVSNIIKNSNFTIDNQKYQINSNDGAHSIHGGFKGLDKIVWDTYTTGRKVIMSHISPHLTEGYPGDLLLRVTFELSPKNEFLVDFDTQTTKPTCINLTHLLYFNLAGHYSGPEEIYRHILTLNCNCYTPQVNKIPTGEIMNVIHTQFDFQVPKTLGQVIGNVAKDGIDQNLCVNRGMFQDQCFVARLLHPPSGRMLEIYSNQPGVQVNTSNHFGFGINPKLSLSVPAKVEKSDKNSLLFEKVYEKVDKLLENDKKQCFEEIKGLISIFASLKSKSNQNIVDEPYTITPIQFEYLKQANETVCDDPIDEDCSTLKQTISEMLKVVQVSDNGQSLDESGSNDSKRKSQDKVRKSSSCKNINVIPSRYSNATVIQGKGQAVYKTHGAISLQTQNYPNAINFKNFPRSTLYPGEVYKHSIVYKFWIKAGNPNSWIKRNAAENKQRSFRKMS